MGQAYSTGFQAPWLMQAVEADTPLTFTQDVGRRLPQSVPQAAQPALRQAPAANVRPQQPVVATCRPGHPHSPGPCTRPVQQDPILTSEMLFPRLRTSLESPLHVLPYMSGKEPQGLPNFSIAAALTDASRAKMLIASLDAQYSLQQQPSPTAVASYSASPVTATSCPASPHAPIATCIPIAAAAH